MLIKKKGGLFAEDFEG